MSLSPTLRKASPRLFSIPTNAGIAAAAPTIAGVPAPLPSTGRCSIKFIGRIKRQGKFSELKRGRLGIGFAIMVLQQNLKEEANYDHVARIF
jgi:hypothetical protein